MNAVDKYEYKLKTDQMLELMEDGSYRKAAEIADSIDWKRVRNAAMLTNVSDIYEKNKEYDKSYNVLNLAYQRAEGSRKIISKLCTLALKTGNIDEAIDYYDDFMQIAPKDPNQYILRYQILRAKGEPIEQQIEALEEYKKSEYIEEWAYELAKLYQEAGMTAECLEECDDLILWFSEGQYVYKAMELKMQYKPLTPSQQEKYDKRFSKGSAETEEMPDIAAYAGQAEEDEPVDADTDQETASDEKTDQEAEPQTSGTEEASETLESTEENTDGEADIQDKEISSTDIAAGSRSTEKKSKIGNTMPLDEALRQLLRPKNTEEAEAETNEEAEPVLDDLEQAIDEIEAVADADMVKQIAEKKKKRAASSAGEMTEIIPDDDDQIDGQMNLEDILNDWEGKPESIEEEAESDVLLELDEGEDLFEPENADLLEADEEAETEDGEMLVEEAPSEPEEIEAFEEEEYLEAEEADDLSEMEGEDIAEGAYEGGDEELSEADSEPELTEEMPEAEEAEPDMIIEEGTDIDMTAGERTGETMEEQKTRKTEPILPPDIQRMIDEIEGVIPPQEEIEKTPVKRTLKRKEEPRENMGKVADSLRIDNEDFNDEDYLDDEYEFDDELDETGREKYFAEDAEEYFDEEAEEFADEEEYFDEEAEEFADEEEYFDEDEEEPADEEEYFDEDEEDFLDKDGYFDSEDYVEDAIDFHEEFRVNPEHADMPDDREIPDDDDDNMDILSATKPLSRKETAKMIATGKTAPLPLDEISDALSMTDTGFIVHGRYDLELQSGIGTRAGLTEEQKKLFSYFVPVRGMSEQLVDVLEQDKNCTNRRGTSRTGNLLIVGNKGNGKTVLAVDVVKAIQKQRNIRQGKVAIVTGDSLNKKKIGDIFDKLYGGALIIEKAGKMNEKTVARLNKAMEKDTGELLIVLEEQRKPIDRLLSSNREFRRKFTSRLEVPIFINDELVTFGQTYAQENGYRVDEMGILALYSKIDSLQREDHAVTVAEVKEIMDEAIQHSQKASAKKLVKRVFGKNTDDADRILLSEKDFNV
ncbi:MAG TPA: hypothetical protein H9959_08820 [Candidatus Mediterraneibacter ornithocaccae]|nr:hypothetical protein [Candidatus Mediterraneibacter ornithocaccae]